VKSFSFQVEVPGVEPPALLCTPLSPRLFTLAQWRELARRTAFDLQSMALLPEVAVSVRTLERVFEQNFGATPSHFLMRWRAEAARDYIAATGAGNKQAAATFGFFDEAHLCHVFKQLFNRSPQSFVPSPHDPVTTGLVA
jgi:transcriptional regulator GlxA family with amidase domain